MIKKLIGVVGVLVLIVVGVGVWYFVIRDDSVEKDTVGCGEEECEESTVDSIDGTWSVVPGESNTSLVITETIGGVADHEVEGNTAIDGTLTIEGSSVTTATPRPAAASACATVPLLASIPTRGASPARREAASSICRAPNVAGKLITVSSTRAPMSAAASSAHRCPAGT